MKGTAAADFLVASGDNDGTKALGFEGAFTVAENTDFRITGTAYAFDATIEGVIVDGTLNVAIEDGLTGVSTFNGIIINGTVNVLNFAKMKSDVATVLGTLIAAPVANGQTEGKVEVGTLFVGATEDYITTGADAVVSGSVTVTSYALVMAGSTVPESVTALAKTEFMVADNLYITAYVAVAGDLQYGDVDAHIENARFDGWYVNGEPVALTANVAAGTAVAKVTYDVYQITVFADEGVANVYIDSNIMQYGMYEENGNYVYGFRLMVATGEHTITYTLKNGWTGTAVLKVNGDAVSGNTFTTEGTPATGVIDYTLQLTGIEKSGYVPDSPDTSDGMTITDYLLIVLVVLIVVMAIIVAMRMMRS